MVCTALAHYVHMNHHHSHGRKGGGGVDAKRRGSIPAPWGGRGHASQHYRRHSLHFAGHLHGAHNHHYHHQQQHHHHVHSVSVAAALAGSAAATGSDVVDLDAPGRRKDCCVRASDVMVQLPSAPTSTLFATSSVPSSVVPASVPSLPGSPMECSDPVLGHNNNNSSNDALAWVGLGGEDIAQNHQRSLAEHEHREHSRVTQLQEAQPAQQDGSQQSAMEVLTQLPNHVVGSSVMTATSGPVEAAAAAAATTTTVASIGAPSLTSSSPCAAEPLASSIAHGPAAASAAPSAAAAAVPAVAPAASVVAVLSERTQATALVTQLLTAWMASPSPHPAVYSVFNGQSTVTLQAFVGALLELVDYLDCGKETVLFCLVYIRRAMDISVRLTPENVFRLLLAGVLAAVKFHDDLGISNSQYARLIGLETSDVRRLEAGLLSMLQWRLMVPEAEFTDIARQLCALQQPQVALA